jgi:hypothetical protein
VNDAARILARIGRPERDLVRSVLLTGEPARASFRRWRSAVELDDVDNASQRLLPLLARRFAEVAPDDPLRTRVRGIYRHAWAANRRLWEGAAPVVGALRDRAMPVAALGGVALLDVYGDDWGTRPMYVVDVLIPTARAAEAIDVLTERGWTPDLGQSPEWVRWRAVPRHARWGFRRDDARVDLHWHVLAESTGARADEGFWLRSREVEVERVPVRVLHRADLLLEVLVRGTVTLEPSSLQWIVDAVMVLRAGWDDACSRQLASRAREHGLVEAVRAALDAIAELVGPELVAPARRDLDTNAAGLLDRLRRPGRGHRVRAELARRSAGADQGLVHGAREVADDVLDLGLATRPTAAAVATAAPTLPVVGRLWRQGVGTFVRTPAGVPPPVQPNQLLDFTRPATLDRHGATGWGMAEPTGAVTRGHEARLVLPLAPELSGRALTIRLALQSADGTTVPVAVVVNETTVSTREITPSPVTWEVAVPATVAARFTPLELVLRPAGVRGFASRLRVRLARVELGSAG